jgi:hypothetical protein
MDFSGDPTVDRIVRTEDTVDMKFDWQLVSAPSGGFTINGQPADSNITVTATLPNAGNGQPAALWTAIPSACYLSSSGVLPTIVPLSSISGNSGRTLVCNLGHKPQGTTGFFIATYRVSGFATDGTQIALTSTIQGDTTRTTGNPQTSSNTQTFWASGTANYDLRLDQNGQFAAGANAFGPANQAGRVVTLYAQILQPKGTETIGTSTCCAAAPHFEFDLDLSRLGSVLSADANDPPGTMLYQDARLYTWNGFTGCNSGSYVCTQAGGPGTNIHVKAYGFNTGAVGINNYGWVYIYVWFPNSAIPAGAATSGVNFAATVSNFDPTTLAGPNFPNGQSNYGGNVAGDACPMVATGNPNPSNCEPGLVKATPVTTHAAANNNEYYGSISKLVQSSTYEGEYELDGDVRNGAYPLFSYDGTDGNYGTTPFIGAGGGYSDTNATVLPGEQLIAAAGIQNNGAIANTTNAVCVKWDNRTQLLTDYGDAAHPVAGGAKYGNSAFAANTWSVVVTGGKPPTPPAVWHPGAKWNRTVTPYNAAHPHNLEADPASYVVEYGVGEYQPPAANMAAMKNATCRNADSPAGWFTNPNDPAIQTWIDATYGAGSGITPLDVVDKARVRLLDDLQPNQSVELYVRLTARANWGPTTLGGVAGTAIAPGTRLAFDGAYTDSFITGQGNNGTTRQNGWYVGNYDPNADSGSYGDRLTLAKVDLKDAISTVWPSGTGLNGVSSVIAGQDVWFRVDPYVYSASGVPAGTPAYPTRFVIWLPSSLTYVPGSGCLITAANQYATACTATAGNQGALEPVIVPNPTGAANGDTALIVDYGNKVPNAGAALTSFTFKTTTDVLSNNGVSARVAVVIESKNGDGTTNTIMPVCSSLTQVSNLSIPATTYGPAETLGVDRSCTGYRETASTVTIWNASGLVFSGRAAQQQIEVNDADDGTGTKFAYTMTTKNFDSNAVPWTDQILALPWNGDGRRPASAFHGTINIQGVSTSDALSGAPNALPPDWNNIPARNGTTFYFTMRPVAQVAEDPSDPSNFAGGSTQWCLQSDIGVTGGCPASMSAVTAVRVISGSLAANGATRTVTIRYSSNGNQRLDVYAFHSIARAGTYALQLRSVDTSMSVVDSSLGGTLWLDTNGNGFIDGNENVRLTGVRVQILDVNNNVIGSTTTDGAGFFNFTGLHSGAYTVQVVNKNGVDGASDVYPALANSYDVDSGSINSGGHPDLKAAFLLAKNVQRTDAVFGFATTSLSGFAWRDDNRDGLVDPGEPPMPNQTITITGTDDLGNAVNRSVTTGLDGTYTFALLRPGTYTVTTSAQPGSVLAYAGSAGGTANGTSVSNIVLSGGMTALNYMFATIAPSAKILIFDDHDGNGQQGANEHGIANVRAHIRSVVIGVGTTTTDTTTTDATGNLSLYS